MLFKRIYQMFYYSLKLRKKIPFKITGNASIKLRSTAQIKSKGRLNVGNRSNETRVSVLPVNIYVGNNSALEYGHSVCIGQGVNLIVKDNAKLLVGDGTYFTSDMHIEVVNEISIGNNCAISWGVTMIDGDHHQVISSNHNSNYVGNIKIGNHVWIGCNCTILRNTTIGDNCIVAAGSVVKGDFPPGSMIAGNPARVVKENVNWK